MLTPAIPLMDSGWRNIVRKPPNGSVLYLPGIEPDNTKLYDHSDYGNHGTITGATWVRLPSGLWVLRLDGTDDYITVPHNASLNCASGFTIEAWIYPNGAPDNFDRICCKHDAEAYSFQVMANGTLLTYALVGGVAQNWASTGAVTVNKFNHVAVSFDGTNGLYVINGASGGTFIAGTPGAIGTNARDLIIGQNWVLSGNLFKGDIDLFRITPSPLTLAILAEHYHRERHLFGV
jgi:hypothetical protein